MERIDSVEPEVLQTKKKANLLYSKLLDNVRSGNDTAICTALEAPDYFVMTRLIMGNDLGFARKVIQFIAPQIARAAIEGGMGELDAAAVYLDHMETAKKASSSRDLFTLNQKILIDYAKRVALLHDEEQFSPLTAQCRAYISKHVCDPLTVHNVASALHISRSYLSRVFKKDTGKTIGEHIREEKIATAKILLRHTTLNIADIAQKIGFSSQSRFTEIFRKVVGVTPRQYRGGSKKAQHR
jgi:AraC-like DNA-binding protein